MKMERADDPQRALRDGVEATRWPEDDFIARWFMEEQETSADDEATELRLLQHPDAQWHTTCQGIT